MITDNLKTKYLVVNRSGNILNVFDEKEDAIKYSAESKDLTKIKEVAIRHKVKEKVTLYGFFNCGHAILNFALSILFVITLNQNWKRGLYSVIIRS